MNESHIRMELELDGKTQNFFNEQVTVVQRHDWHHTFEIKVGLRIGVDEKGTISDFQNFVGKTIKISWCSAQITGGETYNQFNGIMTDISICRHGGTGTDAILKGYSPTILLEDGENTRGFYKKNVSQVVNTVTGSVSSLSTNVNPSPDTMYGFVIQYKESNYAFLSRLAEEAGKWFYYDGKDLNFGSIKSTGDKIELKLGNDISYFDFGMHTKPLKFSDSFYDYINNQVIQMQSSSITVNGLDTNGKSIQTKSDNLFSYEPLALPGPFVKTQSDLKEFSTAKKSAVAAGLVTISGSSYNPKLCIGKKIEIVSIDFNNTKTSYGTYIVTSVTHFTEGRGTYQNKFEAISANLTYPPSNPHVHYPNFETQPAKVVKNNDPDGYGRIKVQFYWQKDGENTPWIRVVNSYAGKNKGFQFIPEVGDEVMVAFEQNDPSRPYVIGSLYHGKASHSDRKDDKNYMKTIRTVSGNEVQFYDKDGEEQILIQNKDGQNQISLSLKNDGMITIQSKNKMQLLAKEILIQGDDKITIKSKEVDIQGQNTVAIESQQDCSIKGMSTKIETTADLSISAGSTGEFKAAAGVTVDGGPMTTVKSSATMEVNGGAMTTIKGGMVMIN